MAKTIITMDNFITSKIEERVDPVNVFKALAGILHKCLPCEADFIRNNTMAKHFPTFDLIAALRIRRRARKDERPLTGNLPRFMVGHVNGERFTITLFGKDGLECVSEATSEDPDAGSSQIIHMVDVLETNPPKRRMSIRGRRRFAFLRPRNTTRATTMAPYLSNPARDAAKAMLEAKTTPLVLWEVENWQKSQPPADPFLLAECGGRYYLIDRWNLTNGEKYLEMES